MPSSCEPAPPDAAVIAVIDGCVRGDGRAVALSIVTPLYRSAAYLDEFHRRISAVAAEVTPDYEIVLVNDGSPDASLAIAVEIVRRDPRTRVVDLARNYGHHRAIMIGLGYARGERVFLIDCDLEVDPEYLPRFLRRLEETGADAVYGVQTHRTDSWSRRLFAVAFYHVFNWFSETPIPLNLVTTRLMTRRYVRGLVAHREREILIAGLWAITGFVQVPFPVEKRWKGESSYNLACRVSLLVDGITSFSARPLAMIFYLGIAISLAAFLGVLAIVVRWAFFGGFLVGWASVIVSIWLLGGLTLSSLGIIGYYLAKVFVETKQRPYGIVRDVYETVVPEVPTRGRIAVPKQDDGVPGRGEL